MRDSLAVTYCVLKTAGVILLLSASASIAAQTSLDGDWQTGEDNTIVRVAGKDGKVVGKLVSSDNPRAKIGTEILSDFVQDDGIWKGTIFAVKRGKHMDATILPTADSLKITVSAGVVKKKVIWTRVP